MANSATVLFAANTSKTSQQKAYSLIPERSPGDLTRITAAIEIKGDLQIAGEGKSSKISLDLAGKTTYDQRLLEVSGDLSDNVRAIRHYSEAQSLININERAVPKRELPTDRLLIVVESKDQQTTMFCPQGNLRRDDLDLISLPFDSLLIEGLLPENAVKIGERWKTSGSRWAQMLGLNNAKKVKIESVLKSVKDHVARIETVGTLEGTVDGASTKIRLRAKASFNLKTERVATFAISFHERRGISQIAPGIDATTRLGIRFTPIEKSDVLADSALAGKTLRPNDQLRRLHHRSVGGHFQFDHDRRWHVIDDDHKLATLRLIDNGLMLAQLDISPLPQRQPGRSTSLAEFKDDIRQSLDKNFGQFTEVSQKSNAQDYRVYRIVAIGESADLPIHWIYYYIADKHGRSVALSFTLNEKLVAKFAGADKPFVESLRLLELPVPIAAKDDEIKKK